MEPGTMKNYQKPNGCLKLTMEPGTILNQKPQGWVKFIPIEWVDGWLGGYSDNKDHLSLSWVEVWLSLPTSQ